MGCSERENISGSLGAGGKAGSSQDYLLGRRLKEVPCGHHCHRCSGVGMSRPGPEHCPRLPQPSSLG